MCIAGRFRLERTVGSGGMGIVFQATDLRRGTPVAVKVLTLEASQDIARLERFRREARAVTQIGHPNIVRAIDAGMVDPYTGERMGGTLSGAGRGFLVMEYLDGEDLHTRLSRVGRLSPEEGVSIARQVASGLAAAHAHGIVHRDLKPENIFLCNNGLVKVLDFGLAQVDTLAPVSRVTAQNSLLGTPEYMSPEQAAGHPVDGRSDIYSLGCILYEMFTGRPPFTGKSFVAVLMAHLVEAPVPPHACDPPARIPQALENVILRALSKDPASRQTNMRALEAELAAIDLTSPAVEPDPGQVHAPLFLSNVIEDNLEEGPTTVFNVGRHGLLAAGEESSAGRAIGAPTFLPSPEDDVQAETRVDHGPRSQPPQRRTGPVAAPAEDDVQAETRVDHGPRSQPPQRRTGPVTAPGPGEAPRQRSTAEVPRPARQRQAPSEKMSPELALLVGASSQTTTTDPTRPLRKVTLGPRTRAELEKEDPLPRILETVAPASKPRFELLVFVGLAVVGGALAALLLWFLLR